MKREREINDKEEGEEEEEKKKKKKKKKRNQIENDKIEEYI
jgi:hypothetical protein